MPVRIGSQTVGLNPEITLRRRSRSTLGAVPGTGAAAQAESVLDIGERLAALLKESKQQVGTGMIAESVSPTVSRRTAFFAVSISYMTAPNEN